VRLGVLLDRFDPLGGGAEAHTDALMRRAVEQGEAVMLATLEGEGPPGVTTRRIQAPRRRPARDRAFAEVGEATLRAAGCDVVLAFRHALRCDVYLPHGGLVEDALAALDAPASVAADPAVSAYLRGIVLKDSNRDAEAAECFDKALALRPDLERAHYHRGTARFLAGDKQGALRDLERAVEGEPDFLFAVYNLGVAAVALRDWERAKRAFARCLELGVPNRSLASKLVRDGGV